MVIVTFNMTQADLLQECHRNLHVAFQINLKKKKHHYEQCKKKKEKVSQVCL